MRLCYRTEGVLLTVSVMMATPLYDHVNLIFSLFQFYFVVLWIYNG